MFHVFLSLLILFSTEGRANVSNENDRAKTPEKSKHFSSRGTGIAGNKDR